MATPQQQSPVRIVPASRRKDGTYRKPVRIKPGFKSEEFGQAKAYESKGKKWRNNREKYKNYVPGLPPKVQKSTRADRRKRARKKKQLEKQLQLAQNEDASKESQTPKSSKSQPPATPKSIGITSNTEPHPNTQSQTVKIAVGKKTADKDKSVQHKKMVRKLKKKLTQIDKLKKKMLLGHELNEPERIKVSSEDSIRQALEKLTLKS